MEEFVEEFFDHLDYPVMVTDRSDLVIYKNPFAKKYLPVPRKGGSIVRYVNTGEINYLDEGRLVALQSVYKETSPYRRAVVFKSDDSALPEASLGIFDPALSLLQREHMRGFLSGLSKTLAPVLIPLIKDDRGIKYLPRAVDLGEPLRILCRHFYGSARELEAAASFNELCPVDYYVDYLKRAILAPVEEYGCPVIFRFERGLTATRYVDFTHYTMIFLRLITLALERSDGRSADILIRCDDSELSTLISYSPKLPKRYFPSGKFTEFRSLMQGDDVNFAMLEALFEDQPKCKFSYEVNTEGTHTVTARFDLPITAAPRRLAQGEGFDSEFFEEIRKMVGDYLYAIVAK